MTAREEEEGGPIEQRLAKRGRDKGKERGPITTSIAAKNRNLRSSVGIRGVTLWTVVVENEKEKAQSKGIALIRSDGPGPCSAQI